MFTAVFPAEYSSLSPISVLVRDYAQRAGFGTKQLFEIEMAVDEACSNIIDHAYTPDQNGEITLNIGTSSEGITIILQDEGKGFDPVTVTAPDLKSDVLTRKERGLGVFLIQQLMDFVHYETLPDGSNQLTIKKYFHQYSEGSGGGGEFHRNDLLPIEALQLVSEINCSISSIVDLEDLLAKITDLIHKGLGYPFVHLYLFDYVPQQLVYVSGSGNRAAYYQENNITYDIDASKGLISLAAKAGRYYLANDLQNNLWHQPDAWEGSSSGSELSLPLQFRDELLGVLDIQSDQTNAFQEQDINLLESLSITISIAIRNAQLFKTQDWRRNLAESYRETAEMLTHEISLDHLLDNILLQIPLVLPVDFLGIWLIDSDTDSLKLEKNWKSAQCPGKLASLSSIDQQSWFHHSHFGGEAISRPDFIQSDPVSVALQMGSDLSAIAAPINSEGRDYGVLTLHTDSPGRYGPDSHRICSTFADYIAYALDKERLRHVEQLRLQTEQELTLARRIQKTFLPETLPQIPGYDLAVEWETARLVGGDFYDVIELEDGKLGFLVADVSDKGLPASLYMTVARTLFRAVACDYKAPSDVLRRVNQLLQLDSTQSFFVTLFYMVLDAETGRLTYSIAGHTPPILIQPNQNTAKSLKRGGIALGILDPIELEDQHLQLAPNESIFLFTDGVTETRNEFNEEYGQDRLEQLFKNAGNLSSRELINLVLQDLKQFRTGNGIEDDSTILVLKRN